MKLTLDGHEFDVDIEEGAVTVNGRRYAVSLKGHGLTRAVTVEGRTVHVDVGEPDENGERQVNADGKIWGVKASGAAAAPTASRPAQAAAPRAARPGKGAVTAQMTGRVLRINVAPGDRVEEGMPLLVIEAMKMENEIRAPRAGTVKRVAVGVGDRVNAGDALVELEAEG